MTISDELGVPRTVDLPAGTIDYRERGEGPPLVFLHGVVVNADLWRAVVPAIAEQGHRCLAPDLPLGSHSRPMPSGADVSVPGVAELIGDFLAALGLTDVTLVANDTAGALTQIVMTRRPERIGRVVLTNCDALDRFFPPMFNYLPKLIRLPGMAWLLSRAVRTRPLQRLPMTYSWLAKRPISPEYMDSYVRPMYESSEIRRDLKAFVSTIHKRHTLAAAERLPEFAKPVLLVWAHEDRLFPTSLSHDLAARLPDARIVEVPDSYTFIPEDQPARLTEILTGFLRSPAGRSQ